jgi:dTDP-glucose 4,6-dehydratase
MSGLSPKVRTLIYGAGSAGTTMLRLIQENPELGYVPVGLIDDDPVKRAKHILGISILGDCNDLIRLVRELKIEEVLITMPSASPGVIDKITQLCATIPVQVRVVPDLRDFFKGVLTIDQVRQWRSPRSVRQITQITNIPIIQNILITGGAGFIGSNFVRHMLDTYRDYRIIVFDKLTYSGNLDNLFDLKDKFEERYQFIQGDICRESDVHEVMEKYAIDTIVNFAAETHVDRSLMEPGVFLQTNVLGTYQLLEAARRYRVIRFHQVSTDEVYGQVLRGSFNEDDPLEPRSPYSASKASGDMLVNAYYTSFSVPATISRGSNNIGPFQYPEKVVPLFITNALEDLPIPIYGDGGYVRDYQYVIDHCRGIDIILHRGIPGEIYNLGGGNEVASIDLAYQILDLLGKPHSLIRFVRDRPGQDRRYSLNSSKTRSLGWEPLWNFVRALEDTVRWYVQHEWWWRKLKSKEYRDYYERQYRDRLNAAIHQPFNETIPIKNIT